MAVSVAELSATLTLDQASFDAGIAKAQSTVDSFSSKVSQQSANLKTVATGMAGIGAAGTAGFGAAVKSAADFEFQMDAVNAALGGVPDDVFTDLSNQALELGASTKFSAGEIAGVQEALGKAGVGAEALLGGATQAVADLAAATGEGLVPSGEAAAAAMNLFGLSANDTSGIADVFTAALNNSSASLTDLRTGINNLGPVMANLNRYAGDGEAAFQDTAAAVAYFNSMGLKAADAGISLARGLTNLADPTDEAAATMKRLGINAFDAQGNFLPLPDLMDQLNQSMSGMSDQAREAALATIFGAEAADVMNQAIKQGGDGLREYEAAMREQGIAAEQAAIRQDNLAGAFEQLTGSIATLAVAMGQPLLGPLRTAADFTTQLVNAFLELPAPIQTAISVVGSLASVLTLGLGGALLIVPKIVEFQTALKALTGGLGLASRAAVLFQASLGPIGIALAVISLAVVAYSQNWFGFRDAVNAVAAALAGKFKGALGVARTILRELGEAFDELTGDVGDAVALIQDWVADFARVNQEMADNSDRMTDAGRAVDGFGEALSRMTGINVTGLFDALSRGVDFAIDKLGGLRGAIEAIAANPGAFFQGLSDGFLGQLQRMSDALMSFLNMLGDRFVPQGLIDLAERFGGFLQEKIAGAAQKVGEFHAALNVIRLSPQLQAVGDWFGATFVTRVGAAISKLGEFKDALQEPFEGGDQAIGEPSFDPVVQWREQTETVEEHTAAIADNNKAYTQLEEIRASASALISGTTEVLRQEGEATEELTDHQKELIKAWRDVLIPTAEEWQGIINAFIPAGQDVIDVLERMAAAGQIEGGGMLGFLDGLSDAQQGLNSVLGTMQQIANLGASLQSAQDVAQQLVGDPGVYAVVDDLLAKGLITLEQYTAAQDDEVRIVEANTRAQDALNTMRLAQLGALADHSQMTANYLETLSKLPPAEQAHALAMMDSANQAKVAAAFSAAYSASLGEIPPNVATDIIANAAAADPVLAEILERYELIKRGAQGQIDVILPDASQQALQRFTAAFEDATVREVNGLIEVRQSDGTTLVYDQFNNLVEQSGSVISAEVDIRLRDLSVALASGAGFGAGMGGGIGQQIADQVTQSAEAADYSGVTTAVEASVGTAVGAVTPERIGAEVVGTAIIDDASAGATAASTTLQTAIETVVGEAITAGDTQADAANTIGEQLVAAATRGVTDRGGDFSTQAETMARDAITNAGREADTANSIGEAFVAAATRGIATDGGEFSTQGQTMVRDAITNAETAADAAASVGQAFAEAAAQGITDHAGLAEDAARGLVEDAITAAEQAGANARAVGETIGRNIGEGLVAGIDSQRGAVQSASSALVPAVTGPIESGMSMESPSRVMYDYGVNIVQGLVLGIRDRLAAVFATMVGLAEGLSDGFVSGLRRSTPKAAAAAADFGDHIAATVQERLGRIFDDVGLESGGRLKDGIDTAAADPSQYEVGSPEWHDALRAKIEASMGETGRRGGKKLADGIDEASRGILDSLRDLAGINSALDPLVDSWTDLESVLNATDVSAKETAAALTGMAEQLRAVGGSNKEVLFLADQFDVLADKARASGGTISAELIDRIGRLGKELPFVLEEAGLAFGRFGRMSSEEVLKSMAVMVEEIGGLLRELVGVVREAFGLAAEAGTSAFSANVWTGVVDAMDAGTDAITAKGSEWQDALITVGEHAGETLAEAMAKGVSQKEIDWLASIGGIVDRGRKKGEEGGRKATTIGEELIKATNAGLSRKERDYLARMTEVVDSGVKKGASEATAKAPAVGEAMADGIADGLSDGERTIVDRMGKIATQAVEEAAAGARRMVAVGEDYGEGFAQGLLGGIDDVRDAARELGRAAEKELRKATESASPSKAAMRVGEDVGQGFADGIRSKEREARRAARQLWNAAYKELKRQEPIVRFIGEDFASEFWLGALEASRGESVAFIQAVTAAAVAAASNAIAAAQAQLLGAQLILDVGGGELAGLQSQLEQAMQRAADLKQQIAETEKIIASADIVDPSAIAVLDRLKAEYQAQLDLIAQLQQQIAQTNAIVQAAREQEIQALRDLVAAQEAAVRRQIAQLERQIARERDPQRRAELKAQLLLEQDKLAVLAQMPAAIDAIAAATDPLAEQLARLNLDYLMAQFEALSQADPGAAIGAAADRIAAAADKMAGAADTMNRALKGAGGKGSLDGLAEGGRRAAAGLDAASGAAGRLGGHLNTVGRIGGNLGRSIGDGVRTGMGVAERAINDTLKGLGVNVEAAMRDAGKRGGKGFSDGAATAIADGGTLIYKRVEQSWEAATVNGVKVAGEGGRRMSSELVRSTADGIKTREREVVRGSESMMQSAGKAALPAARQSGRQLGGDFSAYTARGIKDKTSAVTREGKHIMDGAGRAARRDATRYGRDAGDDLGRGVADGIRQRQRDAEQAARDLVRAANQAARDAARARSPSLLFRDLGHDLGDGLILGIEQRVQDTRAASRQLIAAGGVGSPVAGGGVTAARANAPGGDTYVTYNLNGDLHFPSAEVFEEVIQRVAHGADVAMSRG